MRNCPECNQPIETMCEECGIFFGEPELIVTDLYNYQCRPQRCYRRHDHFKEVLYQFQGKEGKIVPPEVVEQIKAQIQDPAKANVAEIRSIIRKLKLTKYVENAFYITFAITGEQPPYIKREIEDKMIRMFNRIDQAYHLINKQKRKSFMNYYYIIFKLLELMGQKEILPRVPMLRTKIRTKDHDKIWRQICDELDWTYIPTHWTYVANSSKPRQGAYKKKPSLTPP